MKLSLALVAGLALAATSCAGVTQQVPGWRRKNVPPRVAAPPVMLIAVEKGESTIVDWS